MKVLFSFILDNQFGNDLNFGTDKTLDLSGTILGYQIGVEGAKEISKSLETNKTLTSLDLICTFFIYFS